MLDPINQIDPDLSDLFPVNKHLSIVTYFSSIPYIYKTAPSWLE